MSVINTITTLFKADPSPLVNSFDKSEKAAKKFSANGRKALEDFEKKASSIKMNSFDKMEHDLKGMFGKGSKLDFGVDLLTGGGMMMALTETVKTIGEITNTFGELKAKWNVNTTGWQKVGDFLDSIEGSVAPARWGGAMGERFNNWFTGKLDAKNAQNGSEERLKPLRDDYKKFMDGNAGRMAGFNQQMLTASRETIEKQISADQKQQLSKLTGSGKSAMELMFGRDNGVRKINAETYDLESQLRAKRNEILDSARYRNDIASDRFKAESMSDPRQKGVALAEVNEKSRLLEGKITALQQEAQAIEGIIAAKRKGQEADVAATQVEFKEKSKALWDSFVGEQAKSMQSILSGWTSKGIGRALIQGPKAEIPDNRIATSDGGWFGTNRQVDQFLSLNRSAPEQVKDDNARKAVEATKDVEKAIIDLTNLINQKFTFTKKSM